MRDHRRKTKKTKTKTERADKEKRRVLGTESHRGHPRPFAPRARKS